MDLMGDLFTQKVVNITNELPEEVAETGMITTVKKYLERYMDNKIFGGI